MKDRERVKEIYKETMTKKIIVSKTTSKKNNLFIFDIYFYYKKQKIIQNYKKKKKNPNYILFSMHNSNQEIKKKVYSYKCKLYLKIMIMLEHSKHIIKFMNGKFHFYL